MLTPLGGIGGGNFGPNFGGGNFGQNSSNFGPNFGGGGGNSSTSNNLIKNNNLDVRYGNSEAIYMNNEFLNDPKNYEDMNGDIDIDMDMGKKVEQFPALGT
jgi:hypothetical protein